MVDWQMMEGIGGIATALAVLVAVAFGFVQARQIERSRREAANVAALYSFLEPHVIDSLPKLLALPDDAPADRFDVELQRAFFSFGFAMEAAGLHVFNRALPLHLVDRQMGGMARIVWRKVRRYVEAERAKGYVHAGEWWHWLVDRMDADPAPGKAQGAYAAFRDWRA